MRNLIYFFEFLIIIILFTIFRIIGIELHQIRIFIGKLLVQYLGQKKQ